MGQFTYPVVRHTKIGNIQGQWESTALNAFGDSQSFAVLLGYLGNIFAKTCHPGPPEVIVRDFKGVTGSSFCNLEAASKHYQLSRVEVNITTLPNSATVRFGDPDMVKAGVCAFGRSTQTRQDDDWGIVEPQRTNQTMQPYIALAAGQAFNQNPQGFATLGGDNGLAARSSGGETTGAQTTFKKGFGTASPNSTLIVPSVVTGFVGAMVFGGGVPQVKNTDVYKLEIPHRHWYPVQAISFQEAVFRPVDPNCTEFYINLDVGVVADLVLYGTEVSPGIEFTGDGEQGGSGTFNPMNGGFTP